MFGGRVDTDPDSLYGERNEGIAMRSITIALGLTLVVAAAGHAQDVDAARESFWLGNDAYLAEDYPAAARHFREAYEQAPNARVQEYLGRTYVAMGQYALALAAFEQAAADDPEVADEIADTIAGLRADMVVRAIAGGVAAVDTAVGRARGEQPRPRSVLSMELGTTMTDVPVQILSSPRGAEVFIDGTEFGAFGTTPLEVPLFTGPHLIEVRKPHYEPASRVVNVTVPRRGESIPSVSFELVRSTVEATVTVVPSLARVTFVADGGERIDLGTGGYEGPLPAGPGAFIVQHAGRDRRVDAVVEPGNDGAVFEIALSLEASSGARPLAIRIGTLRVVTQVHGGEVAVDGRSIGTGVGDFTADLTPGPHTLRVTLDGHEPFEQTVEIEADRTATVYVNALERARRRR